MRSDKEKSLTRDFGEQYRTLRSPVMQTIERGVCGCDYGGTSWTTRREADRFLDLLGLNPGLHLLEVGAGSGWPGLYLCRRSGCNLTMVDLPLNGLRIAAERATRDRLDTTCRATVADGAMLPFGDLMFDVVSHSDVLCCLQAKQDVLRECRRVVGPKGRMVFTVISLAGDLTPAEHDRALEYGPPFVDAAPGYNTMLADVGWQIDHCTDVTGRYASTARRYLELLREYQSELESVRGREAFNEQFERMQAKVSAIDDSLFRRELYVVSPTG